MNSAYYLPLLAVLIVVVRLYQARSAQAVTDYLEDKIGKGKDITPAEREIMRARVCERQLVSWPPNLPPPPACRPSAAVVKQDVLI